MTLSTDPKVFDKRLIERLMNQGLIAAQDYKQHLASLPDLEDQAVAIEAKLEIQEVHATGHHSEED